MAKENSIEAPNLNNQQFTLNKRIFKEFKEIKEYSIAGNKERVLMSKRLSKYIASFDYFDNSLIVLSATSSSISIASFATVIGTPVRMTSASFNLAFSFLRDL